MKRQGKTDGEIIKSLKESGVTPGEINNAMNQSKIKEAVSNENEEQEFQNESFYAPQEGEEEAYEESYIPAESPANYQAQQENYFPRENYENYPQSVDTNTIMEISEQVFFEKIKSIQQQVAMMSEFKSINQLKIDNVEERLRRIEFTIDKLQNAILEKIGEYGNNLQSIKNEMSMMQDSFGKVMEDYSIKPKIQKEQFKDNHLKKTKKES